ncbi:hypothetical protein [Dechloromonas sp. HYN0024]|jgi:hypothetical protein|uniref:hypothetical protein n=1 Tax=Dechloromonas sp. HYN0024 TaxID=2231055 RepID=UPI000E4527F0|nr:hypothetical protein [Dechloromonas sp. HYN0024]AXS79980.1 hypothetical protein HYN24_08065 [Dechloromonas sp. HYN0024]
MSRTLILVIEFLVVTGLCFSIGMYLATRFEQKKKTRRRNLNPHSLPMSAFSVFDHPAARKTANDDPLEEAELFMIYGKKVKALEVLRDAMLKKRVTRAQYEAFKANHGID